MIEMNRKEWLFDLLAQARAEERSFLAGLGDTERQANGTLERWSAKDNIAHITRWRRRIAERLEKVGRGETGEPVLNVDQFNAQGFEQDRRRAWDDVAAEAEQGYQDLVKQLSALPPTELEEAGRINWYGRTVWRAVLGNSYLHPASHLAAFWIERGEPERARELALRQFTRLMGTEVNSELRATAQYNLACVYALSGQPDQALLNLKAALSLYAPLKETARQDSDLASLRERDEFIELTR